MKRYSYEARRSLDFAGGFIFAISAENARERIELRHHGFRVTELYLDYQHMHDRIAEFSGDYLKAGYTHSEVADMYEIAPNLVTSLSANFTAFAELLDSVSVIRIKNNTP